ncbi:hypothetical protein FOXYSP1_08340 [Fusarium oxysporum f. sp. phaseoli]
MILLGVLLFKKSVVLYYKIILPSISNNTRTQSVPLRSLLLSNLREVLTIYLLYKTARYLG